MARLPDVGHRPVDLTPNRPVARFDAGAIAQGEAAGAQALGRSGEALARALQQGGDALGQAFAAQGRTEVVDPGGEVTGGEVGVIGHRATLRRRRL